MNIGEFVCDWKRQWMMDGRQRCKDCSVDVYRKKHWFNFETGESTCPKCYEKSYPDDPWLTKNGGKH